VKIICKLKELIGTTKTRRRTTTTKKAPRNNSLYKEPVLAHKCRKA
jgi:hypothetical protein